ncbi:pyruvate dehydrogenase (acetyl-transferring), homodimeric type [Cocleimonas sp. KMM 6892]|uniref:pyruvate dehydrogenase (acetyl-transferring), homodimeric type n=1 Tax=unclassified Cocleimonas TaxID=2639732 RepID=UPI002DBA3708|nr:MULTISPECIES: pyruvate dehydrogenase (acetyl-transferring), homodimeric type [unclassified Cocleimonas]MEB8433118.1 pyruvate dehydrogenase (acetyl-transferring), homodimeric type [Cocleimonas sp. KMM 6892]MEC4715901.1 pyruvate dehydrogenase (acetyl-transferring), homodimeric type [Cocleimonas sp. KMM 6895]MEC4745362.1 pyruvate dehydrogenase (acetyl-transferring), homodimeric type [Cocleimonas sp. KMM 6896]
MSSEDVTDLDPQETSEWKEAIDVVIEREGPERARYLLNQAINAAFEAGVEPPKDNTPYVNTIPTDQQPAYPGDLETERKILRALRWNATAMVVKANRKPAEPGGHIASYQSSAIMYEVGYNHVWKGADHPSGGDMLFVQGHTAPGTYARAYLEGRLTDEQLDNFRIEAGGKGLSSYPHPYLMPDFWQFSTVSMGLGPIMAIYQARFIKYLQNRGLSPKAEKLSEQRKVWAFLGDGEMDEPESQGAISLASREKLDNLIFVVNCNLQRLDGPVRGNGKIVQELESNFRGGGWNVIKVLWGSAWYPLLNDPQHGNTLKRALMETVDGEYQNFKNKGGAYVREHLFVKYGIEELVNDWTDDQIYLDLLRGGHDQEKVFAAYHRAINTPDRPTVILMHTVKGYGMGEAGEGMNISHSQKKLSASQLGKLRDRFSIPVSDEQVDAADFYKPAADSPEMLYLHEKRKALGGYLPSRSQEYETLNIPDLSIFDALLKDTGERTMSTTMAMVRIMVAVARNKEIGPRLVPIVPDEARTFGMEGMFRQVGIYAHEGQKYVPMDSKDIMPYKESQNGQMLQEGINEDGAMSSWIAASTSYANNGVMTIPVYIFYSMFGFQRIGDLAWAAGDMLARGFLIGATSGRTTLNGEGLQHQDGHSQLFAQFIPNCISYDPTFAYELAVIYHDGLKRMYENNENVYYYITTLNENYSMPAMPKGAEEGIIKGMYQFQKAKGKAKHTVQLLGCGSILREVIAAADLLKNDWDIAADIWSTPSLNELTRDGQDVQRWNLLHPDKKPRKSWVETCLDGAKGPVIAATDYMKMYAEQIRPFIANDYHVLGTDGFGRSDSREALREHFEVDSRYVAITALKALADQKAKGITNKTVLEAIKKYGIDPDKTNPLHA